MTLQILKKLQSDYTFLRIEIESLKKRVSDSSNDIKEMLSNNEATKKSASAKTTSVVKPASVKKTSCKKTYS